MCKTEFVEQDYESLRALSKETVDKFIGRDMIDEWSSLQALSKHVWEKRFYQAFHDTLREYFDWFDGVHQECPYCSEFDIEEIICPVCQGRGWLD